MEQKIDKIYNSIQENNKYLKNIEKKIELLSLEIKDIKKQMKLEILTECKKMGSHIDFVEDIYDKIKNPLGYIINKVKGYSGTNNYYLKNEENKENEV